MVQKIFCSVSTKVNCYFYDDMVKIRLILINNVNTFTIPQDLL